MIPQADELYLAFIENLKGEQIVNE